VLGRFIAAVKKFYRPLVVAGCGIAAVTLTWSFKGETKLDGLLFDEFIYQRAVLVKQPDLPSPVAVVALDQASLNSEELLPYPRVFLAPMWGKMLDYLYAAKARAVGFDVIFEWSPQVISPGLDAPFLSALGRYHDKTIIGRTANGYPVKPYFFAIGANQDPSAVSYLELDTDSDGVIRHVLPEVPGLPGDTSFKPGLAASLLARIPNQPTMKPLIIAPRQKLEATPTYALIDVLRCGATDPEKMEKAFAGKIVLVGTTGPDEDRKIAPDRFIPKIPYKDGPPVKGPCQLDTLGPSDEQSATIPGVYVHARAVEQVLNNDSPVQISFGLQLILSALVAAGISAAGLTFSINRALALTGLTILIVYLAGSVLIVYNVWMPGSLLIQEAMGGMFIAYMARYLIEERKRRRIQRAFGHYLAPGLVSRMAEDDSNLKLGGEEREITVMFADLSGFTALSEKLSAGDLMATTNRYLSLITEAVDSTGGYVDKFIGDAVMAFWGAPVPDEKHQLHGAQAALDAARRIIEQKAEDEAGGMYGFSVKIGINTGLAVVGNVGSSGRFNYTAVGEAVNIAARLESVPGDYNCQVVIGPQTAEAVKDELLSHELDSIRVKGKVKPLSVYRPLGPLAEASDEQRKLAADFDAALAAFRAQRFEEARDRWQTIIDAYPADLTGPAGVMKLRAEYFIAEPPPADWDGVYTKTSK
jgi:adenylate cyclase